MFNLISIAVFLCFSVSGCIFTMESGRTNDRVLKMEKIPKCEPSPSLPQNKIQRPIPARVEVEVACF